MRTATMGADEEVCGDTYDHEGITSGDPFTVAAVRTAATKK